jgi:PAS domain S-box-containing protein
MLHIRTRRYPVGGIVLTGSVLTALFWTGDAALDSYLFGWQPFQAALVSPPYSAIFHRVLGGLLLTAVGFLVVAVARSRKTGEAYLKLSLQAKLATNAAGDGIYYVDREGCFTFVNRAAAEIFGFEGRDLLGKPAHQMVHQAWVHGKTHPPEECPTLRCLSEKKTQVVQEENLFRRDGESFPAEYVSSPILHEDEVLGAVVVIRDVTERKKYEQALAEHNRELEKINRYRQAFADIMHHDLTGPLMNIQGFAEVVTKEEDPERRSEMVKKVASNVAKARMILEDATRLTRLESFAELEMEDLDLKEVLEEAADGFMDAALAAEVLLTLSLPPVMPVRANRIIAQVPANLISNALKYAAGGHRVLVEAEGRGDRWRVKVKDFGEGVPDPLKEPLFMRYHRGERTGVKGHGLGLAITRRICELHGTSVWIEDNPEGGAVFVFEVPKGE